MLSHLRQKYERLNARRLYEEYITTVVKLIAEMYSRAHGGSLDLPVYEDLERLKAKKRPPKKEVDARTTGEIVTDMWQRIRGHERI